eukprot:scaffold66512_cov46-Attheya_sp.AAC.3
MEEIYLELSLVFPKYHECQVVDNCLRAAFSSGLVDEDTATCSLYLRGGSRQHVSTNNEGVDQSELTPVQCTPGTWRWSKFEALYSYST